MQGILIYSNTAATQSYGGGFSPDQGCKAAPFGEFGCKEKLLTGYVQRQVRSHEF